MIKVLAIYNVKKTALASLSFVLMQSLMFFQVPTSADPNSLLTLINIERVTSIGLLIIAVVWLTRQMNKERNLYLEQIKEIKLDKDAIIEKKDLKIEQYQEKLVNINEKIIALVQNKNNLNNSKTL